MGNFLHSLPWTVALALAQAGDPVALPLSTDVTNVTAEDALTTGSAPESPPHAFGSAAAGIDLTLED
jgi:hypothetical protein